METLQESTAPTLEGLADAAAQAAEEADRTGQMEPRVIEKLRSSGLPSAFAPVADDGRCSFGWLTEQIVNIARGCTSTGWLASVYAYNGRFSRFMHEDAQAEIWRTPDVLIASGLVPSGTAYRVDGGFVVSGEWQYVSGLSDAEWILLTAFVQGERPEPWLLALRADEVVAKETWEAIGMRATASNSVVASEVFVPERRAVRHSRVMAGEVETAGMSPSIGVPLAAVGGLTFVAPAWAATSALLDEVLAQVAIRSGDMDAVPEFVVLAIGEAAGALAGARALMEEVSDALDAGMGWRRAGVLAHRSAYAARLCRQALDALVPLVGTAALSQPCATQRRWRDASVALTHAALSMNKPSAALANHLLAAYFRSEGDGRS